MRGISITSKNGKFALQGDEHPIAMGLSLDEALDSCLALRELPGVTGRCRRCFMEPTALLWDRDDPDHPCTNC
ncbi:MAG: hypothetical protein H7831_03705 [Magnetococcus sp. WYHC-3]